MTGCRKAATPAAIPALELRQEVTPHRSASRVTLKFSPAYSRGGGQHMLLAMSAASRSADTGSSPPARHTELSIGFAAPWHNAKRSRDGRTEQRS